MTDGIGVDPDGVHDLALVPLQKDRTTDDCEMVVCIACLTNSGYVVNGSNSSSVTGERRRRGNVFLQGKDIYMLVDFQDIWCGFLCILRLGSRGT